MARCLRPEAISNTDFIATGVPHGGRASRRIDMPQPRLNKNTPASNATSRTRKTANPAASTRPTDLVGNGDAPEPRTQTLRARRLPFRSKAGCAAAPHVGRHRAERRDRKDAKPRLPITPRKDAQRRLARLEAEGRVFLRRYPSRQGRRGRARRRGAPRPAPRAPGTTRPPRRRTRRPCLRSSSTGARPRASSRFPSRSHVATTFTSAPSGFTVSAWFASPRGHPCPRARTTTRSRVPLRSTSRGRRGGGNRLLFARRRPRRREAANPIRRRRRGR